MKYTTNNSIKTFRNFVGLLLCFSAITPVWATEVLSWADLDAAKGDASIVFTQDIQAEGDPTSLTLTSTEAQVIDGDNHNLIGADGYQIQKTAGTDLTIKNFGSIQGFNKSPFAPNSILLKKLSVQDSVFENNTGAVLDIWMKDAADVANIKNVTFSSNNINNSTTKAILTLTKGTFSIDNLIFDSNTAKNGASLIDFSSGTTTTLNNSIIQNNKGGWYGSLQLSGGFVTVNNSQFLNNQTDYDGGAITVTATMGNISNTTFKNNKALWSNGGAIWYQQFVSSPHIVGSTFENNTAYDMGGALFMTGTGVSTGSLWIDDSSFSGNEAGSLGGGLVAADLEKLIVSNSSFTENVAGAGGAMFVEKQPTFVVDTDFSDNTAEEGGAIYAANTTLNIFANTKDIVFSGNTASNTTDAYNGGAAIYFEDSEDNSDVELNVNATENKKIVFDDTIAVGGSIGNLNINKSGLSYVAEDESAVNIDNSGEIQFNNRVGDEEGNIFNINLYGGKLSIGQNATNNANVDNPDGYINNNNFYVKGASTLNTVNGIIGEFAPKTFNIEAALNYEFDVDLEAEKSDKLTNATNNASLNLSVLNVIKDTTADNVEVTYSDTNIEGVLSADYKITTSTATYDVTAKNDAAGSHLVFAKGAEEGGLPSAIKNGSSSYSITSEADEVIETWTNHDLTTDLAINGNGHGFTTENNLDGINVDSDRTLTMNNVTDMSGFNYAVSNEGSVILKNTNISDDIVNNGTLTISEGSSVSAVSGSGEINVNSDLALNGNISGNTVNVNNAKLSNIDKLGSDTTLNAVGGTINLDNKQVTVKSASFDENSTLALTVNSLSDHGTLTADTISVANGAQLKATLGQGILGNEKTGSVQLLSANNADFNNFTDSFDNKMYHFEKADQSGKYTITQTNSAEDIVTQNGGQPWVANAVKAYVDGPQFEQGTPGADVANKLAALAQNDPNSLIENMKVLAPTETAVVQGQAIEDVNRLFKTIDGYLRGQRDVVGVSGGDALEGLSVWAKPYSGKTKLSRRGQVAGFTTESRGLIVGVEKKISPVFKMGVGFQYDETDVDATRRDIDADTIIGYVYGEYKPNKWFVNGVLSKGRSDYDEHKFALGSKYSAHYDVDTTSLTTMTGYQLKYVTPEVGMRYYNIKRDGYTDSADQRVRGSHTDIVRMVAGLHYVTKYGIFNPDIHFGITYDVVQGENNTTVNLANNTVYQVDGKPMPRLGCELNVGINAHLTDDFVAGFNYMGSYRKHYQEHTGILMMKYAF